MHGTYIYDTERERESAPQRKFLSFINIVRSFDGINVIFVGKTIGVCANMQMLIKFIHRQNMNDRTCTFFSYTALAHATWKLRVKTSTNFFFLLKNNSTNAQGYLSFEMLYLKKSLLIRLEETETGQVLPI